MKRTMTENEFIDIMRDHYSYEACIALFNLLQQYEQDTRTEIEFDRIGICSEWDEFKNEREAKEAYGLEPGERLSHYTTVEHFDGGVLVWVF